MGDFSTTAKKSRNVACSGTTIVKIDTPKLVVERLKEHQDAVDHLLASGRATPLCR